ncbi:MAG: thioredoxin TrxC [Proteobacteria bacterium]|nr:MAG: thioredoxin TrxC [Pseudomonadota bacterium]
MDKTWVACNQCGSVNRVPKEKIALGPKCGSCKTALPAHDHLIDQNSKSLPNLILASDQAIVVDFWAPWCGPCLSFAPSFESASQKLHESFIFAKVNTEADPQAGAMYGVRGIPTLIVFKGGKEVQRISGALPSPQFLQWLDSAQKQ